MRLTIHLTAMLVLAACDSTLPSDPDGGAADADGVDANLPIDPFGALEAIPRVTWSAFPASALPADALELGWQVGGDVDGLTTVIELRAPGDAPTPAAPFEIVAGTRPPTGPASFLAADGSWSATRVDRGSASDGTLITTWPRAEEGEWLLSIQLVDDVGEVVAFDLAAVVVAARPTMRLSINRLAASPDDVVRASVVVAPGTTPEPLRLVGWRVDADGTPIPLTFDHAGDFDAVDPPAESLRLLEDRLTEGTHRVEVRLVDEAGNERVAAGATVIVCDQATAVGGRLMDSEGAALTGAEGSVHAIDLGSGAMRTGAMAGEGSFSLELGPGHWFVTASAIAGGAIFEGSSSVTVGGCVVAPPPIDVRASSVRELPPETGSGADDVGERSDAVMAPPASDGLPRPRVLAAPPIIIGRADESSSQFFADDFYEMMRLATVNDIDSAGPADLRAYAFTTALAMLTGAEAQHELIATLQRALTPHALVTFTFTRVGDRQLADVTLVSLRGGGIALRRVSSSKTAGERWTASELMPLVQRMVTGAGESPRLTMLELIRVEEDYPIDPSLSLFAVSTIAPGSDLMVRGVLTDADRRTFAGRTIAFTCIDPAGARTSVAADTDAMGVARITCPVGTMAGMGSVEASYTRLTGSVYTAPPLRFTVRDPLAALRVGFDRIVAAVNQTIRVIVSGLSPGAEVEVDPSRGSVATSPVTADTAGMASTDFSAPQPGAVEIGTRLASDATQTGRGFVYVGAEAAISILAEPASVVTGGFAELRAVVASSTVPVAGRTVTLVLSGPGTLDATTLTLDAYGEARTRWNAPTAGSGTVTVRASTVIDGETFEASADIGYRDAMPAPPVTGNVTAFLQANGPAVCAGPKGDHLCPYSSMSTSSIPAAFALPESLSVAVYQSGPREVAVDVEFAEDYGDIIRLSIEIEALADEEPRVTANPAWSPTPGVIGSHCVHVLTSPPDPVDRPTAWEVSLDYNNDHTHCPGGAGGSGRLLTIEMVVP